MNLYVFFSPPDYPRVFLPFQSHVCSVLFSLLDQEAYFSTIVLFIRDSRYIFINFSVGRVRHWLPPLLRSPFCLSAKKENFFQFFSLLRRFLLPFRRFDIHLMFPWFLLPSPGDCLKRYRKKVVNVNAKREYFRRGTTIGCDSVRDFMRKGSARIRSCFFFPSRSLSLDKVFFDQRGFSIYSILDAIFIWYIVFYFRSLKYDGNNCEFDYNHICVICYSLR